MITPRVSVRRCAIVTIFLWLALALSGADGGAPEPPAPEAEAPEPPVAPAVNATEAEPLPAVTELIVGAAGCRRNRLAFRQHAGCGRVGGSRRHAGQEAAIISYIRHKTN